MKTIRISEEVWDAIAAQGKFGETEDDVLHRVFKLGQPNGNVGPKEESVSENGQFGWKQRRATVRMTQKVINGKLMLEFDTGPKREWTLPSRADISGVRRVRNEAIAFVRENKGTKGQEHAAIRALTSRGYHVTKQP